MPQFLLHRDSALSAAEIDRLPAGCVVQEGSGPVASADVDGGLAELIAHAVAMARAVPDAELEIVIPAQRAKVAARLAHGEPAALVPVQEPTPPAEPTADSQGADDLDPWELIAANRVPEAERIFAAGYIVDATAREKILALSRNPDPAKVALGVRIARLVQYRTFVMNIRQLADHTDARVRVEVALALGALGGRSLLLPLEKLQKDKNAEVRQAAQASIQRIEGR